MLYIAISNDLILSSIKTDETEAFERFNEDELREIGDLSDNQTLFLLPEEDALDLSNTLKWFVTKEKQSLTN